MNSQYVVRLDSDVDPAEVGVQCTRLAELAHEGIQVPDGFAVTSAAYRKFVRDAGLGPVIAQAIRRYRAGRHPIVVAAQIRSAFRDATLPPAVTSQILAAYSELGGEGTEVAVRCSPVTSADAAPDKVFLHLSSGADVVAACRRCFASLFTSVAVGNREAQGVDHLKATMPVFVQRMVPATKVSPSARPAVTVPVREPAVLIENASH
jgi:phosphoenolpyruvate synthase/pyruvate phosphate dikinase